MERYSLSLRLGTFTHHPRVSERGKEIRLIQYMTHKNGRRSRQKQQRITNEDVRQSAGFFFFFFAFPVKQKSAVDDKTLSISNFDVLINLIN